MCKNKYKIYIFIIFVLYGYFILCSFSGMIMNSDMANMVLEANDILSGNLFLSDWNLTGISFITTDLLFFIIGSIFKGISKESYLIAVVIMYLSIIFTGMLLLLDKERKFNWIQLLLYFIICAFPCEYMMALSEVHTGCFVWCFLGLYFINKAEEGNNKNYIYAIFFLTLAIIGDFISMVFIILPMIFVSGMNLLRKNKDFSKKDFYIFLTGIVSGVLGIGSEKVFYLIGGANKNAYIGSKIFVSFDQYYNKLCIYLNSIFGMFNANFTNKKIASINTILYFIKSIIIILGLIIVFYTIISFIKNKSYDFISLILSLGFIIISMIFIMTNISVDIYSGRYFNFTPIIFAVLIIRFFYAKINDLYNRIIAKMGIYCLGLGFIIASVFPFPSREIAKNVLQEELINTLEENNLTNGYSSFWKSSSTTVFSNNNVKVRAIITNENEARINKWFCKNSWYEEYADFVIVQKSNNSVVKAEFLENCFGKESRIIDLDDYSIYIYDYNISTKLH